MTRYTVVHRGLYDPTQVETLSHHLYASPEDAQIVIRASKLNGSGIPLFIAVVEVPEEMAQ